MKNSEDYIRDLVLNGAANLYESFDTLLEQVTKWADQDGIEVNESQVLEGLQRAIGEGYLQAYILSPHRPHSTPVPFSTEQSHNLYFHVTPKGKQLVVRQEQD